METKGTIPYPYRSPMPNPFVVPPHPAVQRGEKSGGIPIHPSAQISVGQNGYVHGIDGMLHQIAGAFVKEAMPVLQKDKAMQVTIGQAAGAQIAQPVWWLAIIAALVGGAYIYNSNKAPVNSNRRK